MIDYFENNNLINFNFYKEVHLDFKLILDPISNTEEIIQNKRFIFLNNPTNCTQIFTPKKFGVQYIGYAAVEFLNNYDYINNLCKEYRNKIQNSSENIEQVIEDGFICRNLLNEFMEILDSNSCVSYCTPFLINDIYTFDRNFFLQARNYKTELENIINEIKKTMGYDTKTDLTTRYNELKKQMEELDTILFYKNKCLKFFNKYIQELKNLYELFSTTFASDEQFSKSRKVNKYQVKELQIPLATVILNQDNKKKIEKYTYNICSLKELGTISLYHTMLNGNTIKKCGYCNSYFIPKNNKEIYCDRLQRSTETSVITNLINEKNIKHIELVKKTITRQKEISITQVYDKNIITNQVITGTLKTTKFENTKNFIPKDTLKTLYEKEHLRKGNIDTTTIQKSCKDLGKRFPYSNERSTVRILRKMLIDRINIKIKTYTKNNNIEKLKIYTNELDDLNFQYDKTYEKYKDEDELYQYLHRCLSKFDYEYMKRHKSKYKKYKSMEYWDSSTKKKFEKIKKNNI